MHKSTLACFSISNAEGRKSDPFYPYIRESNMTPFEEGKDTENYLLHFERLAKTEREWVC